MTQMLYTRTRLPALRLPEEEENILAPAFRQENDLYALWQMAGASRPPVDPEFDLFEHIQGLDEDAAALWERHASALLTAQSAGEFDALSARVRQEEADRARLDNAGVSGLLAQMAAGVLSPTTFIPVVGATARGAQGVRQAFALGAAASGLQEIPLQMNQLTRTYLESGINIATGTVLNGLLGSTAVYLRQADFQRIAARLPLFREEIPAATIIRGAEGAIVRTGEQVPLQPPAPRHSFDVYHGTPSTELRLADLNPARGVEVRGATFLSDTAEVADQYSFAREFGEIVGEEPGQVMQARIAFDNPMEVDLGGRVFDAVEGTRLAEEAKRLGHDGLIVRNTVDSVDGTGRPSTTYAVFSKKQISEIPSPEQAATRELVSTEPSTAGAKQVRGDDIPTMQVVDPETGKVTWEPIMSVEEATKMDPALRAGEALSRVNPVLRATEQRDAPIRSMVSARNMLRLSDGGVSFRGSEHGIAMAAEGTVEHRFQYYVALQGRAYKKLYDAYADYVHDGATRRLPAEVMQRIRTEFNLTPRGKLNFQQFSEAVTDALNTGDRADIPQVAEVAQFWRKEVYERVSFEAQEAAADWGKPHMFDEILADDESSYMTHVFSPRLVAENQKGFIDLVAGHVAASAEASWERRLQKAAKAYARDLEFVETLGMPAEEARRILAENAETLARMKDATSPAEARIAELRTQARDLVRDQLDRLEQLREREPGKVLAYGEENRMRVRLADATPEQLRQIAQEAVADNREMLLEQANDIEAALPPQTLEARDQARALRRQNAQIARSFGRLEERQAEALKQIERNEELSLAAFQRVVKATRRVDRELSKLSDEAFAREISRLDALWQKAIKAAQRGEERLDRLEERLLFGTYSGKNILEESMRQTGRQQRAAGLFDKLSAAMLRDPEAARAAVQDRLTAAIEYTNRVNNKRAERNALLRQRIEDLDPENALRERTRILESWDKRWDDLEQKLFDAGGTGVVRSTEVDFGEEARRFATELAMRIMGTPDRLAHIDAMAGVRSPMRRRTLNIPYESKREFLEKSAEKLLDRYVRTMGSDIELFRAYGDRSGSRALFDVQMDLQRIREHLETRTVDEAGKTVTEARRARELRQHDVAARRRNEEFTGVLERLRSLRGLPDNANALSYRLGKFMLSWNVATMMGTAAVTSISDLARPVFAHGVNNVFRDSWRPFIGSLIDEADRGFTNAAKRELQYLGVGLDTFTQQRARNLFDILEPSARASGIERSVEYLATKTPVVALFGPWTDAMKYIAGAATLGRVNRAVEDVVRGTASQADIKYLMDLQLTEPMIRRIWSEMERTGTRYKNVILPNTAEWTDHEAMRAYAAAMSREDARLVITPGVEKPLWMDETMLGRLVGQFRSFTMAATSKMLISGLQARNWQAAYAVQGLALSLALGAVSYAVWAYTAGPRQREEMRNASWEQWLDQAIYRSGILGVLGEAQTIGDHFPALQRMREAVPGAGLLDPILGFDEAPTAGRRATNVMGAVLGPSVGKIQDVLGVLLGLDEPTQATIRNLRQLVPYQNVFWFRRQIDAMERGFNEYFNIPERRE